MCVLREEIHAPFQGNIHPPRDWWQALPAATEPCAGTVAVKTEHGGDIPGGCRGVGQLPAFPRAKPRPAASASPGADLHNHFMLPRKARLDSCNNCRTKAKKKKKTDRNLVFCSETKVHLGDKNYANIMHYWKTAMFFAVPAPAGRRARLGSAATPRERLCPSSPSP